jgi:hypothetical protein
MLSSMIVLLRKFEVVKGRAEGGALSELREDNVCSGCVCARRRWKEMLYYLFNGSCGIECHTKRLVLFRTLLFTPLKKR